jgi:hypothetical protein
VHYYGNPKLDHIKEVIDAEVREGVHSLRASYLSQKYHVEPSRTQRVLSDLAAAGDLKTNYQLLCSGEHQNFDADREFSRREDIPTYEITCTKCGDRYTPDEENILVSFEPTGSYLEALAQNH